MQFGHMKKQILLLFFWGVGLFTPAPLHAQAPIDTLKLFTWNIQLLPRIAGWRHRSERIGPIIQYLLHSPYDVVCLQEVFDKKLAARLAQELKPVFPHVYGPSQRKGALTSGGVYFFSRYQSNAQPLPSHLAEQSGYSTSVYKDRVGVDAQAAKGGVCILIHPKGLGPLLLVGTHCQAGDGPLRDSIRQSQYHALRQLSQSVLKAHKLDSTATILYLGDMNTDQRDPIAYPAMLTKLNAIDLTPCDSCYSHDDRINNYSGPNPNHKPSKIDYVLLNRYAAARWQVVRQGVVRPRTPWARGKDDLSDHFAVEAWLVPR